MPRETGKVYPAAPRLSPCGMCDWLHLKMDDAYHPRVNRPRPQRLKTRRPAPTVTSLQLPPSERRNPRSTRLDKLSGMNAVRLMLSEEARVTRVLLKSSRKLAGAVEFTVRSLRRGGRLIYVGAGTSGRLGVLDASECPPTFRTPPEMVVGIIAGGEPALRRAMEGAEDDGAAGARAMRSARVSRKDVVVGIAASGTTPFVWGAIGEATRRGAGTMLLCFNPHLAIPATLKPDQVLAFDLGPEILTGSTRLKCGTATKVVLNLLTTLSMVRLGKVMSNLMVDVAPTNDKLLSRAVRIVRELTGSSEAAALAALARHAWDVRRTALFLSRAGSVRRV